MNAAARIAATMIRVVYFCFAESLAAFSLES